MAEDLDKLWEQATPIDEDLDALWEQGTSIEAPTIETPMSKLESAKAGASQGVTLGFGDEMRAATVAGMEARDRLENRIINFLKGEPEPEDTGENFIDTYTKLRDEYRKENEKAARDNPLTYGAGAVAGSLPAFIASAPAGLARSSLLVGGTMGAGSAESIADIPEEAAKSAALTAIAGKAGELVGRGVGTLAGKAASGLTGLSEKMAGKAMGMTKAQAKRLGAEQAAKLSQKGLEEKIVTPLASTEDMVTRTAALKETGGEMMESAYKQADETVSAFSPTEAARRVEEKLGDFYRSPINKGEAKLLDNVLESILMRGEKKQFIPLKEAQKLKEEIGKVAFPKGMKPIQPSEKQIMARDAYKIISNYIDEVASSVEGATAETLKKGKELYGTAKGIEPMLKDLQAKEAGNMTFGLPELLTGAGAGGVHYLGFPAGVLAAKGAREYGPQMAAVGSKELSELITKAGSKYGSVLKQASERGSQSVSATHFMLMKTDPEYRKKFLEENE